jgi:predicted permease
MPLLMRFTRGLRALLRRERREGELDVELRAFFESSIAQKMLDGMNRQEATRAARLELGSIDAVKDWVRDVGWESVVETFWQDLRYACRTLRRSPGFATTVAVSLALGIGANTAIFTLMDAVMWRMLPVKDPEHLLVAGRQEGQTIQPGFTYDEFRRMRERSAVADLAGYTTAPLSVTVDGAPEPSIQGQLVTGDYFSLLSVGALLGRAIGPADDRVPNGHPVVMLSHGYFQRRFAADARVIGRTLRVAGLPFTIIGVTPPEFSGVEIGTSPDVFVPLMMQPTVMPAFENLLDDPINSRTWVQAIARTKPGVTPARAAAALDALLRAHADLVEPAPKGSGVRATVVLRPATDVSALRRQFSRPLWVLLAMVGLVLLIACANAANLLLARAAARQSEFAMRLALGARRERVVRQLLVESLALAAIGGILGIVLARWSTPLLLIYLSSGRTPIALDVTPDMRILAFTVAVSLVTGLIFGLAPAWRGTRIDLSPALRNVRGSVTRGARPGRLLVVAQLAFSLTLLVSAGLLVRSLQQLNGERSALSDAVVTLRVEPRGSDQRGVPGTSERLDRLYQELIRRTDQIPGVASASMANSTPTAPTSSATIPLTTDAGDQVSVPGLMVYPDYFRTIGIPVVAGRDFAVGDLGAGAPAVCIVNESFVRQFLRGTDPLGRPCYRGRRSRLLTAGADRAAPLPEEAFTIIGVAKDSRYSNPRGEVQPLVYRTFLQSNTGRGQMVLHVRVSGNRGLVVQRIREELASLDSTVPVFDVRTLGEEMNAALVQQRLLALLSTLFGALALVLAAVGLYGLLAFSAVQRKSEMGIRMALGASRRNILWLVISEALLMVAIGAAAGVPAALALARVASHEAPGLLFGVTVADPLTFSMASIMLVLVAVFAAYVPARRAAQQDPLLALRCE